MTELLAALPAFDVETLVRSELWTMAAEWGLRVAYAGLILVVGLWLAVMISGAVRKRILKSERVDPTLGRFFGSIVRYTLFAVVLIAVLQKFGVQTTSLVAMLGAATLAIGLALQGALGDLAAGVLIIVFRPYKLGDFVDIGGKQGTVDDITIFYTAMNTIDNRRIIIHNGRAWGDVIENFTANPTRRMDLTFGISYSDNIDHAAAVVMETIAGFDKIHAEPAPQVAVRGLGSSSVDLVVRCWADTAEFVPASWELTKRVKEAFDAAGITIPFPHQVEITRMETGEGAVPAQRLVLAPAPAEPPADPDGGG